MRQVLLIHRATVVALVAVTGLACSPAADARDFFSSFLGGLFGAPASPPPQIRMPFAPDFGDGSPQAAMPRMARGGGAAYCVRTCDGRYFPLTATGDQTRAEACRSFCPASETKVVYGSNIDNAATETGKPYSELPNAFKYRTELVSGCTCNGQGPGGLAKISAENDPTLRKGDLVAGENGLVIASKGADRRGASANFSPLSKSARAQFGRVPVVAAE